MKRFMTLAVACLAMICLTLSAISEDAGYTVEFTCDGLEYILPGDTSVAMSEILSALGLSGEVTAVEISDTSLFSMPDKTGAWIVTALQPFSTTEWMKVTINGVVYEITVTDTTISSIEISGTDYLLFTGFTATGGTAVDSTFVYGNAVDGNTSTSWHPQSSNTFVEFNTDDPIVPKGYIFNTYMEGNFYPQAWVLKAKANATDDWTELSSYSGQTLSSGQEFQYACSNDDNTAYKYFRFEANGNNNIWLTEIRLYGFTYTHLTVTPATCTATGIKVDCYRRSDGKYFTDETDATELAANDVIAPMIPHTGVYHAANEDHTEYWQCSMCNKYFSDEACTTEITEAKDVTYLDESGTEQTCSTYTTMTDGSTSLTAGWYVVSDDVIIADRITVSGTVNLILTNNKTLTASKGITVGSDATLNIYAQTNDEATMGALVASGTNGDGQYNAGIGGVDNTAAGTITINGGRIKATGMIGAGIGSGGNSGATVGTITINGGIVTAQDDSGYGAGIGGGGIGGKASTINLNGGVIHAAGIGSGYSGGDCSITVNISDGVKKIVSAPVQGGACIGSGKLASGSVTVNFKSGGNVVEGDDKDAVFYDTGEGTERQVCAKAMNHAVTMSDDLKANITATSEYAFTGETVTLTLGTAVDATTLSVNGGAVATTDAGNRQYTFTMPDEDVTVTASLLQTYAVSLPANMEVVSATNAADADGKYITGTTVTFKASFPYAASNVSDGTSTLEPDANGIYTVTVADADITVTATVERSATIDLSDATGDFTAINNDVLTGTTSHTVTITDGAGITLSGATISGGIVCEGSATITLVGTNSVNVNNVSSVYKTAGIQIGGSGTTLTIRGDGTLTATGGSAAAGIGLGRTWDENFTAGSIVIEGGTITASGGNGIGTGTVGNSKTASIEGISIKGGTVNASLGKGTINYGSEVTIGYIKIYDTIDMVDATKITETVTYMHVDGESATEVTASKTDYFTISENGDRRIIVPKDDTDYTITIADGIEHGTVTAAATAKYMETVTVTATPAFGYRFVRLIVKDAQNNDVASNGNTFQMPKGGATVSAEFALGSHGTTEFTWLYSTGPAPQDQVRETIYDGVTTVNIQQKEISYNIWKYNEYTYSKFRLDNDIYDADIPYAGGTGEFYGAGNGTSFCIPNEGKTGYYDVTLTDVGGGKWGVSILPTAAQMDVVAEQTYTGSAITPEPLVIAGSLSLTKGTDYVYSYTNNTNVGTATVRATFQGTYASLGYVEKTFIIMPSTIVVSVTGGGTVTIGDKSASDGEVFGVMSENGANVTLTLTPESGNAVRSVEYGYTNSNGTNMSGFKLPISGSTATLTIPTDMKDGTSVTMTITFVSALAGGADEDGAVALTDNSVTDLAGGWYKVESNITFDHTLNLLGDTHITIVDGKTMTVNTASGEGIHSDYTLTVGGAGALSVTTTGSSQSAICVGNYIQTGTTVTVSGYIGIRCYDDFDEIDNNDFTINGGQLTATGTSNGIWADGTITLSCTNGSDFIKASSYSGTISVADGKVLTDGTATSDGLNSYSGTLTSDEITAIAGKTLHSAYTVTFAAGYENPTGTMDPVIIECGTEYTLPTSGFTAQGKTFSSWSVVIGTAEAMTKAVGDPITVTANTTVTAVWEDIGLKIVQNTLELDAVLNLKYYLSVPQDFDGNGASMTFSLNSQSIPFSSASQSGEYYVFPCRVYAYQMAEPITATFTWQENGETKTLIDTYSVKQYLDTLATDTNTNAKTLALVEAVQNYGHYLQPYLARINGLTYTKMPKADTVVDVSTATSGSVEQANKIAHNTTLDGSMITNLQIRLNINSGTSLMFEFKLADGVSGTVTAMAGGDNFTDVTPNGNGVYRISKQTIAANNLECASSFAVNVGDVRALTTTASVMDYISLALTNSDQDDEKLALAALYEYWAAADSYQ